MMHGSIACVNCHGQDGHGGTIYMMMSSFEAPNISWPALTGPHEDHEPYTEETIKDAITKGVDPNGDQLENYMPRWDMSDEDLNDLINYLKTLS
jgi:mono/diheme cytochrome c family protein